MTSVDEYLAMAEEAKEDNAHVAYLTYYMAAIDGIGRNHCAAPKLLEAVKYAQILKKNRDREAIADWGQNMHKQVGPTNLERAINLELGKLRTSVKQNAAT